MTRARFVWGSSFVALGVLLVLDQAGTLTAWAVIGRWWPLVLVLAGVAHLVLRPRNAAGGLTLGALGAVLLLWTLGAVHTLSLLAPVLLIGLGLWLLTRRPTLWDGTTIEEGGDLFVVFSDRSIRVPAGPLEARTVTTVFGDVDLDLRDATIADEARLALTTVFGDVDLEVPPDWQVVVSGPVVLGDVRVPEHYLPEGAPVLRLQLVTVFGDVQVRVRPAAHATPAAHVG
jgi:hypothetical protein